MQNRYFSPNSVWKLTKHFENHQITEFAQINQQRASAAYTYFLTLTAIIVTRKQKTTRMRTVVARIFSRQVRPLSRLVDFTRYLGQERSESTITPGTRCNKGTKALLHSLHEANTVKA